MPQASVIIPCHNAAAVLGEQLRALTEQQGDVDYDVIVVSNNSSDINRLHYVVQEYSEHLALRLIEANDTSGVSYARNVGARHATGDVLLFCDADDQVGPEWVSSMCKAVTPGETFAGGRGLWDGAVVSESVTDAHGYPHLIGFSMGVAASDYRASGGGVQ